MRRCRPWLGTFVELESDDLAAVEAGFEAIARVHQLMSGHEPGSELSRLNRGERMRLSPDTRMVLERARFWFDASGGLFDPVAAGGAAVKRGALPLHPGQSAPAEGATLAALAIDGDEAWLDLPACIDLGGIAKGHAVDAAIAAMRAAGATHGLVNAGGDMAAFGREQQVTVADPATRAPRAALTLDDEALATSAGLPIDGGLDFAHLPGCADSFQSVTVVAPKAIDADALTKVALRGHPRLATLLDLAIARAFGFPAGGGVIELGLDAAA